VAAETGRPAAGPPATSAPGRRRPDLGRVRRADGAVAAATLVFLVLLLLPWFHVDAFDLGWGYRMPAIWVNGFDSGVLVAALVLFLLASGWALLPAVADVTVPSPRSVGTAAPAALGFLLTLVEWLTTFDVGFTPTGLLALLAALAVLASAVLALLAELGEGRALPRRVSAAARWAARPVTRPGRGRRGGDRSGEPSAPVT
jgi:hypothetical protein